MKIVFMGTPSFAVPSLQALLTAGHDIVAVVTQPDRPSGRGQSLHSPAVKQLALERGLRVEQPEKARDAAFLERLRSLSPELIAVAAYGKILPKTILELPPRGAINVHGSLLPKYRGAAPIQRALLAGDTESWTPDLLVATGLAVSVMTSFVRLAADAGLEVLAYASQQRVDRSDGSRPVIVVAPCIAVRSAADGAAARCLCERAATALADAESLTSALAVEPRVAVIPLAARGESSGLREAECAETQRWSKRA